MRPLPGPPCFPQVRKDSIQINGLAHTGVVRLHANPGVVRGWSRDGLRPSEVVHPTARILLNKLLL